MKTKTFVLLMVLAILFVFLGFVGYKYYGKQLINPGVEGLSKYHIAIIYCSHNDNMKDIVNIIESKLKADVYELKTAVPYPADNEEFQKRIKKENEDVSKVVLDNKLIDINKYGLIVIGTPVIQGKPCPSMQKFLNDNESRLKNKPVASIVKYDENVGARDTMEYLYYKLYEASAKPNLPTYATDKEQLQKEIELWFNEMQFTRDELK